MAQGNLGSYVFSYGHQPNCFSNSERRQEPAFMMSTFLTTTDLLRSVKQVGNASIPGMRDME